MSTIAPTAHDMNNNDAGRSIRGRMNAWSMLFVVGATVSITASCDSRTVALSERCVETRAYISDAPRGRVVVRACSLPPGDNSGVVDILAGFENRTDQFLCMEGLISLSSGSFYISIVGPDGVKLNPVSRWEMDLGTIGRYEPRSPCTYSLLPPRGFVGRVLDITCSDVQIEQKDTSCYPLSSFDKGGNYMFNIRPPSVTLCAFPCKMGQEERPRITLPPTRLAIEVTR
jgi:hypothetical protein